MAQSFQPRGIGLAIAFLLLALVLVLGSTFGLHALGIRFHDDTAIERPITIVGTYIALAISLLATWIMARIEGRSWLDFGLRGGPRAGRQFGYGLLVGLVSMIGIMLAIHFAGGMAIHPANLGAGAVGLALLWAIGFLGTALFEETVFRGYLFKRLGEATSFPIAAIATSLLFGLAHLSNGFDAGLGLVDAVLVGGILAISIQITGSLWWAIGFHAAWDWAESFCFGAADSGISLQGALFHADPAGPVWLSGGGAGPEASAITFAVAVVVLVVLALRLRRRA